MRLALLLLLGTSGFCFFAVPVADNDLWGHIYFGRAILETGELPPANRYSYTAPEYSWINHEVLAECAFAWIYDRFGSPGLIVFKLLVGFATLAVMASTCRFRTAEPFAGAFALVLAASLMSFGYLFRPQIFTFLFLAILWRQIHAFAAGRGLRAIAPLPALFVLWVNTHGGVVAGLGVLAVFAAVFSVTKRVCPERRAVAALVAVSALGLLLNPYGSDLPVFLARDLLRDREISEWQAIPLLDLSNLQFKLVLLLILAGFLVRHRSEPWEAAILALAALASLRHERHLPIFAILATPHVAATFAALTERARARARITTLSVGARFFLTTGVLLIAGTQLWLAGRVHRSLGLEIFVYPGQFPVHAIRYIRDNGLRGNLALPFGWGEYAIWHLYPDCRVSIDGRYTTAYPDEVIEAAWRYMRGSKGWDEVLADASVALVDRRHQTARRLFRAGGWRHVYSDETALVFVRDGSIGQPSGDTPKLVADQTAFAFP